MPYIYAAGSSEKIEIKEEKELEEVYKKLRKLEKEGIEFHYRKETIIKEGVKDERGYLKHLLSELEKALKKGKKYGKINRVEGNLVEIDKGAIHKVHDRDVYIVYDSSERYKGKIEIGAIADAISIGRSYEVKKGRKIEPGDEVKYRGQRKIFEIGLLLFTKSESLIMGERYHGGFAFVYKYNLRGGLGFEVIVGFLINDTYTFNELETDRRFCYPFGIRKYFNYPHWFSPYTGVGFSYFSGKYETPNIVDKVYKTNVYPYMNIGIQLTAASLHFDIGVMYFHGPVVKFAGETLRERPLIGYGSISMTW